MNTLLHYKKTIVILIFIVIVVSLFFTFKKYFSTPENYVQVPIINTVASATTTKEELLEYFEVTNSCGPYYDNGDCVVMRSGPSTTSPAVGRLRNGVVLRITEKVTKDGEDWYKILFANELLYPERVKGDWYVRADMVHLFLNNGNHYSEKGDSATNTKKIVVDVSEQKLYAYDGDTLFMEEAISTGLEFTPTPRGMFTIFKMTPSRFMQGPIPGVSDQVYDLPGVPWNLYFTVDGAVIHGAYWHDNFGKKWSHGCVNLSPENAKKLYAWADIGTHVLVQN
jgi:hypothetical protein